MGKSPYRCALCGAEATWDVSCCGRPAALVDESGEFLDGCPIPCSECDRTVEEQKTCETGKKRMGVEAYICEVCQAEYESIAGDPTCPVCGPFGKPRRKPEEPE